MTRKRGLAQGRGLDALMGDTSATESLQNLPIGALQPAIAITS